MMRSSPDTEVSACVSFEDEKPTDLDVLEPWDFGGRDPGPFDDEIPTHRLARGDLDVRVSREVRRRDPGLFEDEMPTNRLGLVDLDEIETRTLKRPARGSGAPYPQAVRRVPRAAPPRAAIEARRSPVSLSKRSAVLVVTEDTPTRVEVVRARPAGVSADEAVRAARRAKTVVVKLKHAPMPRRGGARHVVRLALLALVLCWQPSWWNVGDLHGRHAGDFRVPPHPHAALP